MSSSIPNPTNLFAGTASPWDNSQRPKSPKSPKPTLENPFLKNPHSYMSGTAATTAPSLIHEQVRNPLMPMNLNDERQPKPFNRSTSVNKTPGPPPKLSLSLMGTIPSINPSTPAPAAGTHQTMEPETPPPVSTPTILQHESVAATSSSKMTSFPSNSNGLAMGMGTSSSSSSSDNWVIAYGYRDGDDYHELLDRLSQYGKILQQQSSNGKNWFAIQFANNLSAEKALCGQPIRLSSSSLCGTVRGSPELLSSLAGGCALAQMGGDSSTSKNSTINHEPFLYLEDEPRQQQQGGSYPSTLSSKSNTLKEEDILAFDDGSGGHKNRSTGRKSICDKFFVWFFGWSSDDDQQHPHSD